MRSAEIRELYEANHVKLLIDIHICARDDVRVMYRCCNVGITTSGQNSHYNYMMYECIYTYRMYTYIIYKPSITNELHAHSRYVVWSCDCHSTKY